MSALARILLAAESALRGGTMRADPARAQQLLVLEYRLPLGCLVHMTPFFEAVKHSRPRVKIAVATRGLGLQVLRHSPFIDDLIDTPDPTTDLSSAVRELRRQLRARGLRPDGVLTGASDRRTRIALLALLGSNGWRGGYTLARQLYQNPLVYDDTLSLIRNNLRLAHLVGAEVEVTRPRVFFSQADGDHAAAILREANPGGQPIAVFVTQNSGGQSTGWHIDRFVKVIRHAALELGCTTVYAGTAADGEPIAAIRKAAGGLGTSLAGRTTVSQLAAVLAISDFAVTLDTGTMHVGRAAGLPMVVLGPSWQRPLEWMPLGVENIRILRGPDRPDVPPGYRLDEIEPEAVIDALSELFSLYPPSFAAREARLREGICHIDHLL